MIKLKLNKLIELLIENIRNKSSINKEILSRELGIDLGTVESILGLLISQGILEIIKINSKCNSCPLNSVCSRRDNYVIIYKVNTNRIRNLLPYK